MRLWKSILGTIGLLVALTTATGTVFTAQPEKPGSDPAHRLALPDAHNPANDPANRPSPTAVVAPVAPVQPSSQRPVLRLRVGTFDPRDQVPTVPRGLGRQSLESAAALQLVQFPGPIQDPWIQAMASAGLETVTYMPDYAYVVWGTPAALQRLASMAPVRWYGPYEPAYALHPDLWPQIESAEHVTVTVQIYDHAGANAARQIVERRATRILRPAATVRRLTNLVIVVDGSVLSMLVQLPGVVSIEPAIAPARLDEVQDQILAGNVTLDGSGPNGVGYLTWLTATVGLTTTTDAYPIVDITDDGIDDGDATPRHPDFYTAGDTAQPDRLVYNANWTTDPSADGGGGHGNLNAAIVGGYNALTGFPYEDANGYNYGLGVNPFGPIAGSKIFGNLTGWAYPDYVDLVSASYRNGARIVSNSWGDTPGASDYLIDDQIYDGLVRDADPATVGEQPVTIIFAAGNSGARGTIGSPANAKNVITVGASESYRPTWLDGCGVPATGANNANDIAYFSSRGPTLDGRVKPDLVASGTHIQGAASQSDNYPSGPYVCDFYHPEGQLLYAASSGTSHATPAVSGAASLLTHYYESRLSDRAPSPAMVKAYLINAARYLDGEGSGDTLPSNNQGYGAVDLGVAFDGVPRMLQDQDQILHTTGESTVLYGVISDSSAPLRVTLAWTDPPGPTTGDAYVNNLDLTVSVAGQTYRGNVFTGAYSVAGGPADAKNNVESVFLPPGIQGTFTITVTATNLAGDGVPDDADPTDQDFALVCYNCDTSPIITLDVTPETLSLCRPATGVYTITPSTPPGFSDTITLSVSGLPVSLVSSLAPNPITGLDESYLTITTTTGTTLGSYALEFGALSVAAVPTVTASLEVVTALQSPALLVDPSEALGGLPTTPTLTWISVPEATGYRVEIAADPAFSTLVYTATTAATSHTVAQRLTYETTYYWRVVSANACGDGAASSARSFSVGPALGLEVAPAQVAVCQATTASYTVTTTSADLGTPVTLRMASTPTDALVAFTPNPVAGGNISQLAVTPALATPAGTYTLAVVGDTPTATVTTTAGLDVLSAPLVGPSLISPTDTMTRVAATPTLVWTSVPEATGYVVQIATDSTPAAFDDPATRVYSATTAATLHTVATPLKPDTTYYWRVLGRNGCGTGTPSTIYSFHVAADAHLRVIPGALSLCQSASASYTVGVPLMTDITGSVTLAVQGTPTETTTTFSQNPILAGQESVLTITTTAATVPGTYTLQITGIAAAANPTATATLDILAVPQAPSRLVSPDDATVDVAITPTLSWESQPTAESYSVEIASDPAFGQVVYTATTTDAVHAVTQPLRYGKTYYWRVRSTNLCGSGSYSAAQMFITVPFRTYFPVMFQSEAPTARSTATKVVAAR